MKRATREWVTKAEADFHGALDLQSKGSVYNDLVAFHCQQSSEKNLKAILEENNLQIPKTHDLDDLIDLLLPLHPTIRSCRRAARALSRFAVATRYPGLNADKRQTAAALRWADQIRKKCREILGLK